MLKVIDKQNDTDLVQRSIWMKAMTSNPLSANAREVRLSVATQQHFLYMASTI